MSAGMVPKLRRLPLLTGAVVGAIAYVLGYALTLVVLVLDSALTDGGGDTAASGLESQFPEFLGTIFYNAHLVTLRIDTVGGTDPYHILDTIDLTFPDLVYQLVPVVVLLVAGVAVATRVPADDRSPAAAGRAGATIALAYLPLVLLGTRVFEFSGEISSFEFTVWTPALESSLRAGLIYPLVLGALGGLAYHAYRTRRDSA